MHSVIRNPGTAPYSKSREALLRHFGRTPRQLARECREIRTLGDRLTSELLDHVMGLLPDIKTFYEVLLLDALPDNARVAALQHADLFAMARAADAVVLESRASEHSDRCVPTVSSLSLLDSAVDTTSAVPLTPQPAVAAVGGGPRPPLKKSDGMCAVHARWGKEAYKCQAPRTCKMRNVIARRPPPPPTSASGNGKAGGQ